MTRHGRHHEQGVAVVTALLLTTLAITIVASLFWQQQVQVRSIENQRLQLQKQWILRGALDWTKLILNADLKVSPLVDHLGEPWAVPLAETRLDQYVENGRADSEASDAALSGSIIDAQSRFNLTNLYQGGKVNTVEVAAFQRLLTSLQLNPALAEAVVRLMESAQKKPDAGTEGARPVSDSTAQPMSILHVDDLLAVPGFTPEILEKLRNFIVVLPQKTAVNVNTASAEVLAAIIPDISSTDARGIISNRERIWFRSKDDFAQKLPPGKLPEGSGEISVSTSYFLVNGVVRLNRAGMQMQALIARGTDPRNTGTSEVKWIRAD